MTTVAASTQTREFASTLTLTAAGGDTLSRRRRLDHGRRRRARCRSSCPRAAPYSNAAVRRAGAAPALFTGKIVACQRGVNARVEKGFNVLQGGAAGMILYNPALADVETDNHWLPTVHLADGTAFVAFMSGHTRRDRHRSPPGQSQDGQGDVMAAFSSRGPAGLFIKPDVTAPGVQILAGTHADPGIARSKGPPGEYFQAIAGTSMSSPHVAGAGHPARRRRIRRGRPGQIKSALMTTAIDRRRQGGPGDAGRPVRLRLRPHRRRRRVGARR